MIAAALDDNYERIKADLAGLGLTYDRLIDDLLDHVCCMVEEYMDAGKDFESSYSLVLESIGEKRLPEIQHQTFLNLDKKYQHMKNFTYIFGLSSALLTIIGAFFKKMHWPGAGILVTVGIVLVVLVFLPLYFITKLLEWAGESCDVSCLQTISSIHADARSIQVMITSMQEDMKTFLEPAGASLAELKGKDSHGAGREVIVDSGNGHDFAVAALEFRVMLEELIKDPVTRAQINDHLEFTGKVWSGEYGVRDVEDDPFMRTYYKLSNASRGIALAEYVAISRLLHP